jgi:hypothetical protein
VTEQELDFAGLPKLRHWSRGAGESIRGRAADASQSAEGTERRIVLDDLLAKRSRLWATSDRLMKLRDAHRSRPAPSRPSTPEQVSSPRGLLLDDPFDTRWANVASGFDGVAHVFHQEWHGIRAAVDYSPGHKIGISCERSLTPVELERVFDAFARWRVEAVVFHGFSVPAEELMLLLRERVGPRVGFHAVWHGSTAQFHHEFEQDVLERLCELRSQGMLRRLVSVKPGLHLLSPAIDPLLILNLPPRLDPRAGHHGMSGAALIPVPNDWRKNFYTNLYAAAGIRELRTIYVTAGFSQRAPFPRTSQVVLIPSPTRHELFRLAARCDVVCNASLSECQPMTALEALALGIPCVTGRLGLGDLDEDPYQRLAQVSQHDSLEAVRAAIETMLAMKRSRTEELQELMSAYRERLRAKALASLREFLDR